MQINTRICVTVTKDDGSEVVLERSVISKHGGNPSFERGEVAGACKVALADFVLANALAGTRPL